MKNSEKQLASKYGNSVLYSTTVLRPLSHVSKAYYRSSKVDAQIREMKASGLFQYETGNDAPKGGKTGEYHRFTPKVRRLGLKRKDDDAQRAAYVRQVALSAKLAKDNELRYQTFLADCEKVATVIDLFCDQIAASKQLAGVEKSNRQAAILKEMLSKVGIEQAADFWQTWKFISKQVK
jgi:hypothetical protein